jgi:hypothetical protein
MRSDRFLELSQVQRHHSLRNSEPVLLNLLGSDETFQFRKMPDSVATIPIDNLDITPARPVALTHLPIHSLCSILIFPRKRTQWPCLSHLLPLPGSIFTWTPGRLRRFRRLGLADAIEEATSIIRVFTYGRHFGDHLCHWFFFRLSKASNSVADALFAFPLLF